MGATAEADAAATAEELTEAAQLAAYHQLGSYQLYQFQEEPA